MQKNRFVRKEYARSSAASHLLSIDFYAMAFGKLSAIMIFLILVADRKGLSYYSYDNICTLLRISVDEYIITRNALIENQTPLSLKNPRKLKMKGVDRDKEKNY